MSQEKSDHTLVMLAFGWVKDNHEIGREGCACSSFKGKEERHLVILEVEALKEQPRNPIDLKKWYPVDSKPVDRLPVTVLLDLLDSIKDSEREPEDSQGN